MEALGKIAEAGISCGIALLPIIPYITDSDEQLENLIRATSEIKANYVLLTALTLEDECRAEFIDVLKRHFPKLVIKTSLAILVAMP